MVRENSVLAQPMRRSSIIEFCSRAGSTTELTSVIVTIGFRDQGSQAKRFYFLGDFKTREKIALLDKANQCDY